MMITKTPYGYLITRNAVAFTALDLAWFRCPLGKAPRALVRK